MARFYRTSSATPIDYMYQLNIPLMQQAMQANEAGLNAELQQSEQLGDAAAKFNYLTPDAQRAAEITKSYSTSIDDIAKSIQADPVNWRRQKGSLRDLSRKLKQDYSSGEISKIVSNYSKYKELDDYISKKEEAGKLTPYEGATFRSKALQSISDGTGYNPQTGTYNMITATKPMDTINIRERLKKLVADKKANGELKWDQQAGQYLVKTTTGYEGIRKEDLIPILVQGMQGDSELLQYMKQRSDFGLMNGVYDSSGNFINPYISKSQPLSDVEKDQLAQAQMKINQLRKTNPEQAKQLQKRFDAQSAQLANRQMIEGNSKSSLYPTISSIADEMSYTKVKEGVDITNNSLYNLRENNAFQGQQKKLDRDLKASQFDRKMAQAQDMFDKKMDWEKYKWENPHDKTTGRVVKATDAKGKPIANPVETTVGEIQVNPYYNQQYYSNDGVANSIKNTKDLIESSSKKLDQYDNQIKQLTRGRTYEQLNPDEKQQYTTLMKNRTDIEDEVTQNAMTLTYSRQLYTQADTWAKEGKKNGIANMTDEQKAIYESMQRNPGYYQKLEAKANQIKDAHAHDYIKAAIESLPISQLKDHKRPGLDEDEKQILTENEVAQNIKKQVAGLRDEYLKSARQQTANYAPSVELGTKDGEDINALLQRSDLSQSDLFDNQGNKGKDVFGGSLDASGLSFDYTSDNYAPVFGGDKNFRQYLEKEGGKIKVMGISPSLGFDRGNSGAVMRVRIVSKDGKGKVGSIPADKDYFVTLSPQLQMQIGEKLITNKDASVVNVGKLLLDGRNQTIRNAFLDVRNHVDPETGQMGAKKQVLIPYGGNKHVPINVRSYNNGKGDYDYYVTFTNENGDEIPMRDPITGKAGFFNSIDHFQEAFDQNLKDSKFIPDSK